MKKLLGYALCFIVGVFVTMLVTLREPKPREHRQYELVYSSAKWDTIRTTDGKFVLDTVYVFHQDVGMNIYAVLGRYKDGMIIIRRVR